MSGHEPRTTTMKSHKDLEVWRAAIDLARDIYELAKSYPKDEQYGIVSQMKRSAVSIASNIPDGGGETENKRIRSVPLRCGRLCKRTGYAA